MKRLVFGTFCFSVLLQSLPSNLYSQQAHRDDPRLRLYVGEIKGDEDVIKSVRDYLVNELSKRGVALSPSEDESDVILLGTGIHRVGSRLMIRGHATMSIVIRGDMQLNARDGKKLWTSDVSSTRWAVSQTGSFAEVAASRTAQVLRELPPHMNESQRHLDKE